MALTIADMFEHAADLCGDHTALVCGDDSLTYAEVLRAAVVNVNYRCVAEEQNSDAVAVVCEHLPTLGASLTGDTSVRVWQLIETHRPGLHDTSSLAGSVGRIASSGHIPLEYYKDPAQSAATFVTYDGVRYALPGDLARIEGDGSVTLLGRGSNCINSGGEKVFPEEVEGALKAHDDVFDVLVVGVDDNRLGQHVGALIQPRQGGNITLDGLAEAARDTLARYKLPRSVWVVDFIRRSPAGKPDYPWARKVTQTVAPTESRGQFNMRAG